MKLAVGSDSKNAFTDEIVEYLKKEKGVEVVLCGSLAKEGSDYVDTAAEVAVAVSEGNADQGVLFCNTGTGVTIVANKVAGVRAALCPDSFSASIAKKANNANVLVLGMRLTGSMLAKEIVDTWFETPPSTEERRMNFHRKTDEVDEQFRK